MRAQPTGTNGTTGHLFQHTVGILGQIRESLHPVPVHTLLENVVPRTDVKSDVEDLSTQLDIEPIIANAADGGIIHRRRLCWLSVDWGHVQRILTAHAPWSCQWQDGDQGWPRLYNPIAATLQPALTTTTHSAPANIQNQGLTAQAPDANGRPPPARSSEKPDTMARWQEDRCRFAPEQYQSKYLSHPARAQPA